MRWRAEISYKPDVFDAVGHILKQDIADLGIKGVEEVRTGQIYWLEGDLPEEEARRICEELLADPITQTYKLYPADKPPERVPGAWTVEVRYKPGVTDSVGDSVVKGARDMGINSLKRARSGQKYVIRGNLSREQVETICRRLLYNEVIQDYELFPPLPDGDPPGRSAPDR